MKYNKMLLEFGRGKRISIEEDFMDEMVFESDL